MKIIKNESPLNFYRGISTVVPTMFIPSMIYFISYENFNLYGKNWMK